MNIQGGGKLYVFSPEDEFPHQPGDHQNWQESFVIFWYDASQSVGGFFRLGHEPNYDGGQTHIFSNIFSPEGTYHRSCHIPLKSRHRTDNGFASGDDTLRYEVINGVIRWTLKDNDVDVDISVDSYVPPYDAHRREGQQNAESYTGAHVDAACAVSGTVIVKGKTYLINDVLAFRDHGWGNRDWDSLYSHRWNVGVLDRENSFVALTLLNKDYKLAKFGWVVRGDNIIFAEDVTTRAIVGEDGATNFGGTLSMTLTTGEVFDVVFRPVYPSVASWIHNTMCYDTLCAVSWGRKTGFGIYESTHNHQGGTRRPTLFSGSVGIDGWYRGSELIKAL